MQGAHDGDPVAVVALLLAVVLTAAKVGGEVATRLKQPPVLGELLAGLVLGNLPIASLASLRSDPSIDMLSRLGILILLFEVGLESTVREVLTVGAAAARVATLGTVGSFAVGFLVARLVLPDASMVVHAFVAASITATSVGITARVFKDLERTKTPEARTILGASVLDDVIGLVVLAVVSGLLAGRGTADGASPIGLALTVAKTIGFLAIAVALSMRLMPRVFRGASHLRTNGVLLALGLSFCFFLSWAADAVGLAPLVGAFAAGLVLDESHSAHFVARGERSLAELLRPLSGFLVPIFFVVMGIRAEIGVLLQPTTLVLAALLTVAAVAGKLSCALVAGKGVDRLTIAVGMVPRGEVTLIFANLALTHSVMGSPELDRRLYSALVAVVVLTTLLTPALLTRAVRRSTRHPIG
jgi:Kef-type K+ transport system membrane component KefB